MSQCHICGIGFNSYVDFHEHVAMTHTERETKVHSSGRLDLGRKDYTPMAKADKVRLVAQGEIRLGKENFYESL